MEADNLEARMEQKFKRIESQLARMREKIDAKEALAAKLAMEIGDRITSIEIDRRIAEDTLT